MAKKIFATDDEINAFLRSAQEQLIEESRNLKRKKFQGNSSDGITLNFKIKESKDDRKATIEFSDKAWIKIFALVHTYSTEVEWHGVVERKSHNTFYVKDILIFPHVVTGSTVTSDQKEYEAWLDTLDNDSFNALRFHGHSHVNMGVSPSGVDMEYRRKMLNSFGTPTKSTDYFYIFLIFNKRGEISGEIYDLQNNALYSTDEITIVHEEWLSSFLNEAKRVVKEHSYSPNYFSGSYGYNYGNQNNAPAHSTADPKQKNNKHGSKYDSRQMSALDDEDSDLTDEEYYDSLYGYRYGKSKNLYYGGGDAR